MTDTSNHFSGAEMTEHNLLYWVFKACDDHWMTYHEHMGVDNIDDLTFMKLGAPPWVWQEFKKARYEYVRMIDV